jgi:serine/threonine protein phosphatase PrpC
MGFAEPDRMETYVELEAASATHAGLVRPANEDSVVVSPDYGLAILADGMGGYNAGEVASEMATTILRSDLEADLIEWWKELTGGGHSRLPAVLQARITRANTSIFQASQSQPQYAGMGTTLVLALFLERRVTVAHLGDSRLYRLRGDEFRQITRDHSLLQEQLDAGLITAEQAKLSQNKNLVTRALGVDPVVDPEIRDYDTQEGDVYLLCSDGLSDMVEDEEIGRILLAHAGDELQVVADALVDAANAQGGRDNVSAILVRIKGFRAPQRHPLARFLNWLR